MTLVRSELDGVAIAFDDVGSGTPTILFVPGLTGDRSDFVAQIEHFAQAHRVVAVDLPGHGASGRDRSEWSMKAFGADVVSVVEHLDLRQVVLVGHSFGGDVVVEAAEHLREKVVAAVLVSSYRSLGAAIEETNIATWLAPFRADFGPAMEDLTRRNFGPSADPAMVATTSARMRSADPRIVLSVLESKMRNEPAVVDTLRRVSCPVFAINSDFKPNDAAALARHGIDLRVVPGVGHYVMMEDPDGFNAALAGIIGGFSGSG